MKTLKSVFLLLKILSSFVLLRSIFYVSIFDKVDKKQKIKKYMSNIIHKITTKYYKIEYHIGKEHISAEANFGENICRYLSFK